MRTPVRHASDAAAHAALARHVCLLRGALCCPSGRRLFTDPVCAADGFVLERECMETWFGLGYTTSLTTGCALEHTDLAPAALARAALALLAEAGVQLHAPRTAFVRVHGRWKLGGPAMSLRRHTAALQEALLCPITRERMRAPATTMDGVVYDRDAIQQWFARGNSTSPMTGLALAPALSDAPLARALQALLDATTN